jgi:hypothetical protein
MRKIEIKPLDNGSHRNQTATFSVLPEGWAVIPDDMETPNFPFGEIEIEEIDGVMTVTKWTAGVIPETEEPENDMSKVDQLIETLYKTGKLTEEEYKQIVGGGK